MAPGIHAKACGRHAGRIRRTPLPVRGTRLRDEGASPRLLLSFLRRTLHFFSAAFDVLAEPLHRVARGQAEGKHHHAQYGNDFFHDFSFLVNE